MLEEVRTKAHEANKKAEEVLQKALETKRKNENRTVKVFKEYVRATEAKK
jgi:hypothetical protein